jgi:hypothetical protein
MTAKVRAGLRTLVTLAESWREADGDETLTPRESDQCDAAVRFVRGGGLYRPGDADEPEGEPTNMDLARAARAEVKP